MNDFILYKNFKQPKGNLGVEIGKLMNNLNHRMNNEIIEKAQIMENARVLEVGFGNGAFISNYFKFNKSFFYFGIDASETLVEIAKKKYKDNLHITLEKGSSDHIPFENNFFDIVILVNVVDFWEDNNKNIIEIKRVLKNEGEILIANRKKEFLLKQKFGKYIADILSEKQWARILENNSFSNITIDEFNDNAKNAIDTNYYIISGRKNNDNK